MPSGHDTTDTSSKVWKTKGTSFLHRVSQTLVSVELSTEMRTRRSGLLARRVILKTSITSVLVLSIAFIITYSVMLMYISDRAHMMRHHESSFSDKTKNGKRTKLLPRPFEVFGSDHVLKVTEDTVVKWNVEAFNDVFSFSPKCVQGAKFTVLITSSPENYDRRKAIRDTWCDPLNFNVGHTMWQCVFLVGHSAHMPSQIIVENEMSDHRDILRGSYVDSYRNLTTKVLHGLYWSSRVCPAKYVLKTDDDVFVNAKNLLDMVITHGTPTLDVYIGHVYHEPARLVVIRDTRNKWSVTYDAYPHSHYPPYASGMGYLLSQDVVGRMVNVSRFIHPFANEDAYIGVLANKIGVEPFKSGRFTLVGSELRTCNFLYLVVIHYITADTQQEMLNKAVSAPSQCASERNSFKTWH